MGSLKMSCILLTMEVWGSSMPVSVTLYAGHWVYRPLEISLETCFEE